MSDSSTATQLQNMASISKEQQTDLGSSENIMHEINSRLVPTFLDPLPQPELHPMRLTAAPVEPVSARWDWVVPRAVGPEHSLQRMDQELQRLASEMNRLWSQPPVYRPLDAPHGWLQPSAFGGPDFTRFWNQSAVEREAALQRLWNQSGGCGNSTGVALPTTSMEVPRGFVRLNAAPQPSVPSLNAPWGATAHAEAWRKKENFYIDNPVVKGSDGHSQFRLEFDLRQFNAGEVEVRTDGHLLTVQAKHEELSDKKQARREYFRQCTIPEGVDPKTMVSHLSPSGILSVSAPLKAAAGESMKSIDIRAL
ncbi:uncharacterized protein LOC143289494 [Babylonia areolata]|uniref:uncharacterized protein LOC143289494 n=1 Tax=Babylonia areolata TaxID=304850 RepID=UPI003FD5CD2B